VFKRPLIKILFFWKILFIYMDYVTCNVMIGLFVDCEEI